ncbi:nicotinate phosphoribosyltransferase [Nanoarchaeota archaeon]
MNPPELLKFDKDIGVAVADFYEYSMANANIIEKFEGKDTIFDFVLRRLPKTKVVGRFEYKNNTYDEVDQRNYMINMGLEQAMAIMLECKGNENLRNYMENVQNVQNEKFLDWAENIDFTGDVYAMKEGELYFGLEQQMRVHEKFEEAQVYETLLLATINPQSNVATLCNDIAEVVPGKILLEGGSRRGGSPQGTLYNSRAAIGGGFTASSNVAFGMAYDLPVGGTHGHSYVMLHSSEYDAFQAQANVSADKVCFLLDTYNVNNAVEKVIQLVNDEKLNHFAVRIDSGDLLEQSKYITKRLKQAGFDRNQFDIVASDDLTAFKIKELEENGAEIDKYLVGTYAVNPSKPLGGVYKLAAFYEENELVNRGKLAEDPVKSTLPGIKQTYRISNKEGMFVKDVIALEGEDISQYVGKDQTVEELLIPVIKEGKQVYENPSAKEISQYRQERLSKLPKKYQNGEEQYPVIISDKVMTLFEQVKQEYVKLQAA